jgi:hypothetical protein
MQTDASAKVLMPNQKSCLKKLGEMFIRRSQQAQAFFPAQQVSIQHPLSN